MRVIRAELKNIEFSLSEFVCIVKRFSPVVAGLAKLAMVADDSRLVHMSTTMDGWHQLLRETFDDGRPDGEEDN